ncbi:MAG: LLM class flavin-dependent oxidoreductase [Pseudonocardiaceae bacterium]
MPAGRSATGPPLTAHWFLPTYADSRYFVGGGHGVPAGSAVGIRPATLGYLTQVARAAEQLGFAGALTPAGAWCQDAWLTTAMLVAHTERLRFLVAFRPGLLSPTLAAQMAATYQQHSGGRLLLNVVTGGESAEQRAYGKDARYAHTAAFLRVVRALWDGETVAGDDVRVAGARLEHVPDPVPPVYFGGSSPAAVRVAAEFADVYLTGGEPLDQVAGKIEWVRRLATAQGRSVRFGIRLHVITRDTAEQAWAHARTLLDALHGGGSSGRLEVAPNLWVGVGLARGGAGTALVGSHTEVADRIAEYHALGIEEFVLSGQPHIEEAWWFGEGVLPLLRRRGLWRPPAGSGIDEAQPAPVPFARAR